MATKKSGTSKRQLTVKIGKDTFDFVTSKVMEKLIYAQVIGRGKTICINAEYAVKLRDDVADAEHKLGCILRAVAVHYHPHDAEAAEKMAADLRRQMEVSANLKKVLAK